MANYSKVRESIVRDIRANGNQEITGQLLQDNLIRLVNAVAPGDLFVGFATPATEVANFDANVFYIASVKGVYPNFGGISVEDEMCVFSNRSGVWQKTAIGVATKEEIDLLIDELKGASGNAYDSAIIALESAAKADKATSDSTVQTALAAKATLDANNATQSSINQTNIANIATSEANTARDNANTAADNANAKAVIAQNNANLANAAATTANNSAVNADAKASLAQTAADNANNAADNANNATTNANNAATNANAKAVIAQQAADSAKTQGDYAKAQGDYAKSEAQGIDAKIATKANQSDLDKVKPSNAGTTGQVLTKTSTGQEWKDSSGGGETVIYEYNFNSDSSLIIQPISYNKDTLTFTSATPLPEWVIDATIIHLRYNDAFDPIKVHDNVIKGKYPYGVSNIRNTLFIFKINEYEFKVYGDRSGNTPINVPDTVDVSLFSFIKKQVVSFDVKDYDNVVLEIYGQTGRFITMYGVLDTHVLIGNKYIISPLASTIGYNTNDSIYTSAKVSLSFNANTLYHSYICSTFRRNGINNTLLQPALTDTGSVLFNGVRTIKLDGEFANTIVKIKSN